MLGALTGLAERLRAAAEALGETAEIEAAWLRGAAELVERGEPERRALRADAVWLEELAPEARVRKSALLSAWVDAAEALRTAIHELESERGPLVESLFPVWRGPSLRRHADQARGAEAELQRRLSSGYVVRRLAELATHATLGTALEALAGAGAAWAAERDRPALGGAEADTMRARLLALAERTTKLLERVRWVVRASLADRLELVNQVFPKRGRAGESLPPVAPDGAGGPVAPPSEEVRAHALEARKTTAAARPSRTQRPSSPGAPGPVPASAPHAPATVDRAALSASPSDPRQSRRRAPAGTGPEPTARSKAHAPATRAAPDPDRRTPGGSARTPRPRAASTGTRRAPASAPPSRTGVPASGSPASRNRPSQAGRKARPSRRS